MSGPATPRKGSRSKSGCKTCRARKIRCDERIGVCLNCEKLGLPCSGPSIAQSKDGNSTNDGTNVVITTGLKRKRTFRSCTACRGTKTRCTGDRPICVRCQEKGLQCNYEDSSEPAWTQQVKFSTNAQTSPSVGEKEGASVVSEIRTPNHDVSPRADTINPPAESHGSWLRSSRLPEGDQVRVLVEHYFVNIHPLRCFGFLHKPSFMQRLDAANTRGLEDDALLLMVCSLGALFVSLEIPASNGDLP